MAKAKKKDALSLEEKLEQALVPVDEQPYEVPENWCWLYLGALLTEIKNGTTIKQDKSGEGYSVTRIESLQNQTIDFNRLGTIVDSNTIKETDWYQAGDIAMSHINSAEHVGKTAMITENMLPLVHGMNLLRLRFYKCCLPRYFQYFTQSYQYKDEILKRINMAVNQVSINQKQVGTLEFPLPPLAEQQRIVEQIENLFAKLDEAKEKLEDTINGFQIRKVSILHNAFTGQLTKSWRENQGKLDTVYKKEELQNLTSVIGDGLHGTPCYDESGEYYFINGNNFAGKNIEIKADTKTVNTEEYEKHKKKLSAQNTIFVSINGTLGKTAFYNDEPIILGKSACYLNVLPELNKYYLRYYFETEEFTQYANEKATGSTIKNLGLKAMRELQINVPSIEEQEEIVRLLDKILYRENEAKEKAKEVLEQIDLIKKAILAKAFRGELGTNNPDEESAVELLKSILATE